MFAEGSLPERHTLVLEKKHIFWEVFAEGSLPVTFLAYLESPNSILVKNQRKIRNNLPHYPLVGLCGAVLSCAVLCLFQARPNSPQFGLCITYHQTYLASPTIPDRIFMEHK